MTGDHDEDGDGQQPDAPTPWHNSTPKLLGASVVGLAVIAAIVAGATALTRQLDEPDNAPADYVEPTFSDTSTSEAGPSTTSTATTTRSIQTTEINPGDPSLVPPPPPGSETPSTPTRTPRTRDNDNGGDDEGPSTTRSRPRLNETRTLYPRPN